MSARDTDLDSFGELYVGFGRDREILKKRVRGASAVWRRAFRLIQRTDDFYQRADADVARETMRTLMAVLKNAR